MKGEIGKSFNGEISDHVLGGCIVRFGDNGSGAGTCQGDFRYGHVHRLRRHRRVGDVACAGGRGRGGSAGRSPEYPRKFGAGRP